MKTIINQSTVGFATCFCNDETEEDNSGSSFELDENYNWGHSELNQKKKNFS